MEHPIRKFREANGVTLQALADLVGVQKAAVSKWESGRVPAERVPDVERVTGIPRHLLRPDLYDAPNVAQQEAAA